MDQPEGERRVGDDVSSIVDRVLFFFSSRRRHTRSDRDWSSDVCSSDLDNNVPFTDFASLCRAREVTDLIWSEIERVNQNFARVETIKKFRLIEQQLTEIGRASCRERV